MTPDSVDVAVASRGGSGMWKYWALLFAAVALVLAYTYVADPCHRLLRADFARIHPGYVLLQSEAEAGSPESVRCRITYRAPEGAETREDVWVYQYRDTAWEFSRIAEARGQELTGRE
jgi:hypothetical protein